MVYPKHMKSPNWKLFCPPDLRHLLDDLEQDRLTEYATVMRYPGDYNPVPLAEAQAAVELAGRVRAQIRKLLPREVLHQRKS